MDAYSFTPAEEAEICNQYILTNFLDEIDPYEDRMCSKIAKYLADGLNCTFRRYPDLQNSIVVRSIYDYDAIGIDLSSFPVLKVFRREDRFISTTGKSITQATAAYCLSFPDQRKLPGMMRWVARLIDILLLKYNAIHEGCFNNVIIQNDRRAQYRILLDNLKQPVYAYLSVNFEFEELSNLS
jgi:hypothetical protein